MGLSRKETNVIKGISIILIMYYNFIRSRIGIDGNEEFFSNIDTNHFVNGIRSASFPLFIFSFIGWIGVPLFIFVSGYGLSKKYYNSTDTFECYFKNHAFKLLKLLIPMYLLFLVIDFFIFENSTPILTIIEHLSLTINFLNYREINPGVYWFFGLIMQFYLLYFFIRNASKKQLLVICVIGFIINYCWLYCCNEYYARLLRLNFVGWIVPFVLGMIFSRININLTKPKLYACFIISTVCLSLIVVTKPLIPFTEVAAIVMLVSFSKLFSLRILQYVGAISSSIFVIHPIVRHVLYNTLDWNSSTMLYCSIVIFTILVISFSMLHNYMFNKNVNWKISK